MSRRLFILGSWIPAALWAAAWFYIRPYDGWGAWAAAPLLLPSLLLSVVWAGAGTVALAAHALRGRPLDRPALMATFAGGSVLIYYVVRYLVRPAG